MNTFAAGKAPHLRLVSFGLCPYVHRATIMLLEKGATFEIDYIDLANKPEWFLRISPRGKVPVLLVDGTPLFESAAINEYLDETIAPRLLPDDPIERARHRAWVEVANDLFMAQYRHVTAQTDDACDAALREVKAILARFEETLAGELFAGARFGLVDAAVAPVLFKLVLLERHASVSFFDGLPKVSAWARRLSSRPSVIGGVGPDYEREYVESLRRKGAVFAKASLRPAALQA